MKKYSDGTSILQVYCKRAAIGIGITSLVSYVCFCFMAIATPDPPYDWEPGWEPWRVGLLASMIVFLVGCVVGTIIVACAYDDARDGKER